MEFWLQLRGKLQLFIGVGLLVMATSALAQLSITVLPLSDIERLAESPTSIVLEGEIDADSPRRLKQAISGVTAPWIHVYLSSPGGNLVAGMKIGRILREANATVTLGLIDEQKRTRPAICLSACSLAFLGGSYRFVNERSLYGMHRAFTSRSSSTDLDVGQIISAAVASYMREMDVDVALLDLMVKAGRDGMYVLSTEELTKYRVVNNGRKNPVWTLEAFDGGVYLNGVQESIYGTGKVFIFCQTGKFSLISSYSAGEKSKYIAKGGWVHSLFVNDSVVPLQSPERIEARGIDILANFALTRDVMSRLQTANIIGHAMQLSRDAPTFVGYTIEVDSASRSKVRAFFGNCLR